MHIARRVPDSQDANGMPGHGRPYKHAHTRVGVGCIIVNQGGQVLIGVRKAQAGNNQWQFPGGHLEWAETFEDCAVRETVEETNLEVEAIKTLAATNDYYSDLDHHYVTIFVLCRMTKHDQEVQNMEPDKCELWKWVTWDEIVAVEDDEKFLPIVHLIRDYPVIATELQPDRIYSQDLKIIAKPNSRERAGR